MKLWKADLRRAGVAYVDDAGRQVDRHATRTTLGTMLQKAGVSPRAAQDVLRHASMSQTLRHYTDADAFDVAAAVDALPDLTGNGDVSNPEKLSSRAANA
ncbi:MAG: tyrosine-type recombinase/integrase [Planctomycetota bacterium]